MLECRQSTSHCTTNKKERERKEKGKEEEEKGEEEEEEEEGEKPRSIFSDLLICGIEFWFVVIKSFAM